MSTLYFHFYWELASTGNFELRVLPSVLLGLMILTIHTNWGAFRALPLKTVYRPNVESLLSCMYQVQNVEGLNIVGIAFVEYMYMYV